MFTKRFLTICTTVFLIGCIFQSKNNALKEMCDIPDEIINKPTEIGPYLSTKIHNREVQNLLANLVDPKQLEDVLKEHDINPADCDIMKAASQTSSATKSKPKAEQNTPPDTKPKTDSK